MFRKGKEMTLGKYVLLAALLAGSVQAKDKPTPDSVTAVAIGYTVVPHVHDYSFTVPGQVNTYCYTVGQVYFATMQCTSYAQPPTDVPLVFTSWTVTNQLIMGSDIVTLRCTAHRNGSNCARFDPDSSFRMTVDGAKASVEIAPNKWHTYDLVDRQPLRFHTATISRPSWCFHSMAEIAIVADAYKREGMPGFTAQVGKMANEGFVFTLHPGEQVQAGPQSEQLTAISSDHGICYATNNSFTGQ